VQAGYAFTNWLVVLAGSLDIFRLRYWREGKPIRQFVLYEKKFGWMDVWDLNPVGWDHFGQRLLRCGGKSFWLRAFMIGEQALPLFQLFPGMLLTTEKKYGKR
jgi:hypothetical protein